jgi:hypothetical protein
MLSLKWDMWPVWPPVVMHEWMWKKSAKVSCRNKVVYPELSRISLLRELNWLPRLSMTDDEQPAAPAAQNPIPGGAAQQLQQAYFKLPQFWAQNPALWFL